MGQAEGLVLHLVELPVAGVVIYESCGSIILDFRDLVKVVIDIRDPVNSTPLLHLIEPLHY